MRKSLLALSIFGGLGGIASATPTQVANGYLNTCEVDGGALYCLGDNSAGQIGDGTTTNRPTFTTVSGMTSGVTAVSVAIDGKTVCAIKSGVLYCWGDNTYGQVGDNTIGGTHSTPTAVVTTNGMNGTVLSVSTSKDHTCASQSTNGSFSYGANTFHGYGFCWGDNSNGALGNNNTGLMPTSIIVPTAGAPFYVASGPPQFGTAAGLTCFVEYDNVSTYNDIMCAGVNGSGQLGRGTTSTFQAQPLAVSAIGTGSSSLTNTLVSASATHVCALSGSAGNKPYCWGANLNGEVGDGTSGSANDRHSPTAVTTFTTATSISAGGTHTCATTSTTGACWGGGSNYQLDNGAATTTQSTPVNMPSFHLPATSISAGDSSTCFIHSSTVICTGPPVCGNGVLDPGETCDDGNASSGDGCSSTCAVESGYGCTGTPSTCALLCGNGVLDASESCDDGNHTSGDGCSSTCAVESGYSCTGSPSNCALTCGNGVINSGESCDDGNVNSGDGCSSVCQLESGYTCSGSPTSCVPNTTPRTIAGGYDNSCKITGAGALYCWGDNGYGEIDSSGLWKTTPVAISGMSSGVTDVSVAGDGYTVCAIKSGSLYCWGDNTYGQIGDGTTTQRTSATLVSSLSNVQRVATAGNHTCALVKSTTIAGELDEYCWGDNTYGQLGLGNTTNSSTNWTPRLVRSGGPRDIAANSNTTCEVAVVSGTSNIYCWGRNDWGQLGLGNLTDTSSRSSAAMAGVQVSMGFNHTCGMTSAGTVKCWGANDQAQVGNGNCGSYAPCSGGTAYYTTAQATSGSYVFDSITLGGSVSCGTRLSTHQVFCWGYGGAGQMTFGNASPNGCEYHTGGRGGTLNEVCNLSSPAGVQYYESTAFAGAIGVGGYHTIVQLLNSPTVVHAWGHDAQGQLGDGSYPTEYSPVTTTAPSGGW